MKATYFNKTNGTIAKTELILTFFVDVDTINADCKANNLKAMITDCNDCVVKLVNY